MNNEVVSTLGSRALPKRGDAGSCWPRASPLLEIEDLNVQFVTSHGTVRAVEDLSYSVHPGEMVAIVGESGSGKSVSALAVMRLLPPARPASPRARSASTAASCCNLSDEEMRRIRGRDIAMIFQEPMTSLNPVLQDRAADHGAAHHPSAAWTMRRRAPAPSSS